MGFLRIFGVLLPKLGAGGAWRQRGFELGSGGTAPLRSRLSSPRVRGSSTPRVFDSITGASEYWVARWSLSSGGHSADPVAGDDG